MPQETILVTGAGGPASSNVIRSLREGDPDLRIVGADSSPEYLEIADVDARYVVPYAADADYIPSLARIVAREGVGFIHPQPDPEVAAIARAGDALMPARTALPPAEVVDLCHDKSATQRVLEQAGVPVPHSRPVTALEDLEAILGSLGAPAKQVWLRATRGAQARGALPVRSASLATEWIRYWGERGGLGPTDFMAAEFLPGREFAFQSIWWEGRLVSSQARQRLAYLFGQHTPSGQTSTPALAQTVHLPQVNTTARAAIRAVAPRPHGIFCVDLKEDDSGEVKVMEINPGRFFTTSYFFTAAGANMPYAWYCLGTGRVPPPLAEENACPNDLLWVRNVDVGFGLVRPDAFRAVRA